MTGLLSTCGLQFQDWSAAYRLFSQQRLDTEQLFAGVRQALLAKLPAEAPPAAPDAFKFTTDAAVVIWQIKPELTDVVNDETGSVYGYVDVPSPTPLALGGVTILAAQLVPLVGSAPLARAVSA